MNRASYCVVLLSALVWSGAGREARSAEPDGSLMPAAPVFLPIPRTPWPGFSDMVIEPGGTVWVMANHKVFYWAGSEFREPLTGSMQSGYYLAGLYGGEDRGAYATQKGKGDHEGLLYRLSDGGAYLVTSFYYEVPHEPAMGRTSSLSCV